jgi:DNA-binding NtrC family response regulator
VRHLKPPIKILGVQAPEVVDHLSSLIVEQIGLEYDWPGNVRELTQCVRRLLLNQNYEGLPAGLPAERTGRSSRFVMDLDKGTINARLWLDAIAIRSKGDTALTEKSSGAQN